MKMLFAKLGGIWIHFKLSHQLYLIEQNRPGENNLLILLDLLENKLT